MTSECPRCGSDDTDWLDIMGDIARPVGSTYLCNECGKQFNVRSTPERGVEFYHGRGAYSGEPRLLGTVGSQDTADGDE